MLSRPLTVLLGLLAATFATTTYATPAYNNDAGTYTDPITTTIGFVGLASPSNPGDPTYGVAFVPGSGGYFTLDATSSAGQATTVDIVPGAKSSWSKVYLNYTGPASAVHVTFIDGATEYDLGPLLASTDPAWTAMVSLAAIPNTVTQGRLRFNLAQTLVGSTSIKPTVQDFQLTWAPKSETRLGLSSPTTVAAGAAYAYSVQVAVSNVTSDNLVVYVPRPTAAADPFGQPNTLAFQNATNGGQFTTGALTIDGRNVPANSIYWQLGDIAKGTTLRLNFTMRSPNGTLSGTAYGSASNPANPPTVAAFSLNAPDASATGNFTTVTSSVNIATYKTSSTGTYRINNAYYANAETAVTWNIRVANWEYPPSTGAQYYPDAVVTDCPDASFLNALVGVQPFTISNGGSFDGTCIRWSLGTMGIGQQNNLSYTATLKDSAALASIPVTQLNNTVTLSSGAASNVPGANQTRSASHVVNIGIPETPGATFAKGVRIRGQSSVSASDDLPFTYVTYGEQLTWLLYAANTSASSLRDTVMVERITDFTSFQSAFLPAGVGTIYYNTAPSGTDDAPAAPPGIDVSSGVIDGSWTLTPPSDLSTVTYVLFRITELASAYFPEDPAVASATTGEVTVTIDAPTPGTCPTPTLKNYASFNYYGYEAPLTETPVKPVTPTGWVTNMEPVDVKADVPSFFFSNASAFPTALNSNGTATFTINVTNQQQGIASTDNALNTRVRVNVPSMNIGGTLTYLPLSGQVQAPNGIYQPGTDASFFTVDFGTVPGGETRTITATFSTVPGFLSPASFSLSAAITGSDDVCGDVSKNVSAGATITASPWLVVSKESNFSTVAPDEDFVYTLSYTNAGPAASVESWIVDRIPAGTTFVSANAPTPGGEVRFAHANGDNGCTMLPATLNEPNFTWSQAVIDACFSSGSPIGGGQFEPADGAERWIAFRVDHGDLTPKQLPVGGLGSVSFSVHIDPLVPVDTTTLRNNAAIFADDLLAAVSNDSLVLVANRPSLALDLTCPDVHSAGEDVVVALEYYNDSTTSADTATVSIEVPPGYVYVSATHAWNANSSAMTGTPTPVVTNGGQTITWDITAAAGGPLGSLQGGTFTVNLTADAGLATGTLSQLTASSTATLDGSPTPLQSAASCAMLVQNPDLCVSKDVNQPAPLPGEQVTWFVTVSNVGLNDAEAVTVVDTLPAGLTYVPGSTSIVSPIGTWSFAGSSDPSTAGSTLTWANLKHINSAVGYFGPSGNNTAGPVTIGFKTTVSPATMPGTTLNNQVAVSTTTTEDDVCANTATAKLKTPLPDPWITKSGPTAAKPGDLVTWAIRFGNKSRAAAGPVLLIDDVPDLDDDGQADIKFTEPVTIPADASIYYHGDPNNVPAPSFNSSAPTTNGWTSNYASLTRVNWIAVYAPSLAGNSGPFTAYINFLLVDPVTNLPVQDASSINNCVALTMTNGSNDADPSNNSACAPTLKTPGLDLAAGALCQPGGSNPGATVGDEIAVVLSASNPATRPVYGVKLTWIPPAGFDVLGDDSATVNVTDISGSATSLVDEFGNAFNGNATWTKVGNTWYLGTNGSTSDPDNYRRIGLPADGVVRITVAGVVASGQSNNSLIGHSVTVATDNRYDQDPGDPREDIYTNNDAACDLTVYLADPFVEKTGQGTTTSGPFTTGDQVTYTLSYNNAGGTDADDVTLVDFFPAGLGFVVGSLSNIPDGATVSYICCDGATPCTPAGVVDFNICGVEFHWDTMPAPANATAIYNTTAQFNTGTFSDTIAANGSVYIDPQADTNTGTWTSDLIPTAAGGNVVDWIRLAVESSARSQNATLTFDILHGVTGDVLATGLTPDLSGGINLATLTTLDGVPTIRVVAHFEGKGFGCDYTYDHGTPFDGVVQGTENYDLTGCAGPDNMLYGQFSSQSPDGGKLAFPAVWNLDAGTYTPTILPIENATIGGFVEGALSQDILVGYLYTTDVNARYSAVVAWIRGTSGQWTIQQVAGDLGDPNLSTDIVEVRPDIGRMLVIQRDDVTEFSQAFIATWDAPTASFVVDAVPLPEPARSINVSYNNEVDHERHFLATTTDFGHRFYVVSGDTGSWTVTELTTSAAVESTEITVSGNGTAVLVRQESIQNDGRFVLWKNSAGDTWTDELLALALPSVTNAYPSWISNDGNALATVAYRPGQTPDFFQYLERQPDNSWARVDILQLPSGFNPAHGQWTFDNDGHVWGYASTFPSTGFARNFYSVRDPNSGVWTGANFTVPDSSSRQNLAFEQPMLGDGILWAESGTASDPYLFYTIPDTFPLGTFEPTILTGPSGPAENYLTARHSTDRYTTIVDGCTLAVGSSQTDSTSVPVYWDTTEFAGVPASVDSTTVPGTPDGRYASRGGLSDFVVGQIGNYIIGESETGSTSVTFVSTVTTTGPKSWAIQSYDNSVGALPSQVAEIARDGSWVAGLAFDANGEAFAVVWNFNALADAYDAPVLLPQDPNAAGQAFPMAGDSRWTNTTRPFEGLILASGQGSGSGSTGAWVPSSSDPSGTGWAWLPLLPDVVANDASALFQISATAVDASGNLRVVVFVSNSGPNSFESYALVRDATVQGGYRVEPLTVPGFTYVVATDIGQGDVITGGVVTDANSGAFDALVFVPSSSAPGTWTAQQIGIISTARGSPTPGSGAGTIVTRRTFADTGYPLIGGRIGGLGGAEQFVLQPNSSGIYAQVEFDGGAGTGHFEPFELGVGYGIDSARANPTYLSGDESPFHQPGFENGFVTGAYFATDSTTEPVAAMQVFDASVGVWKLVSLPADDEGTFIVSVGLAADGETPVVFGYENYTYCAPGSGCPTLPDGVRPVAWTFPQSLMDAVRVDLTPPGFSRAQFVTEPFTSSSNFGLSSAGSVAVGAGITLVDDGRGGLIEGVKVLMFVAANDTVLAFPTDYLNTETGSRRDGPVALDQLASDYIVGSQGQQCDGGKCRTVRPFLWGCSDQSGVTLDRLEAIYRTDADPSVSYNLEVPDICQASFTNNASISMLGEEVTDSNNTAEVTLPVATANISVTISADPGIANQGDDIVYTVTVANSGPETATDVSLVVTLPTEDGLATTTETLDLGDIAAGTSQDLVDQWTVRVASPDAGTNYLASAAVTTTSIECSPDDNTDTTSTLTGDLPNVFVRKTAPITAQLGAPFNYTITFGNNGNTEATSFTLSDAIPSDLTILPGSTLPTTATPGDGTPNCTLGGQIITCSGDPLAVGEWTIVVPVVANDCGSFGATVVNTATVTATDDVNTADNVSQASTTILAAAGKMNLLATASHGNVESGDQVTFVVHYQNNGTGTIAGGTSLAATIPAGTSFVFSDTGTASGGIVTWPLATDILPGQSGAVAFTVLVGAAAPTTLTSVATFDAGSPQASGACDATASARTDVVVPGVHIMKQASRSVTCGGNVDWVLTATNTGAVDRTNLTISDTIASGYNLLSTNPTATVGGSTISWNIPLLGVGDSISVYFTTTAPGGAGTYVTNRAQIKSGNTTLATTAPVVVQNNCNAAMTVTKAWDNPCAQPGDTVKVTVRWQNTGGVTLTGATVSDFIQGGFDGSTIVPSVNATYNAGTRTLTAQPGNIVPGGGGSFTYSAVLTAADGDTFHNVATMTATDVNPAVSNQVNGVVLDCDDNDVCTRDYCDPLVGCVNTLQPNDNPELCDGTDNDCDGLTDVDDTAGAGPVPADDGLVLELCDLQAGVCEGSTTTPELCVGGVWQPCTVEVYENFSGGTYNMIDDTCDTVDEDCDGSVDEEFDGGTSTCGSGACAATGTVVCTNGVPTDDCTPGQPTGSADTICNGIDDNCDGEVIDEESTYVPETVSCGENACAIGEGMTYCENGAVQDDCAAAWSNISTLGDDFCLDTQPTPSDLIVIYLIVQGPDGQDAGSVRCWQNNNNGEVACDTEGPGSSVLKIYPELLCLAPNGGTP